MLKKSPGGGTLPRVPFIRDADETRLAKESAIRLGRELTESVPAWIQTARESTGSEQRFELASGAQVRAIARADDGLEELWLAMPTMTAGMPGLLRWEVARLGITER